MVVEVAPEGEPPRGSRLMVLPQWVLSQFFAASVDHPTTNGPCTSFVQRLLVSHQQTPGHGIVGPPRPRSLGGLRIEALIVGPVVSYLVCALYWSEKAGQWVYSDESNAKSLLIVLAFSFTEDHGGPHHLGGGHQNTP